MGMAEGYVKELQATRRFFGNTLSVFVEEESAFAPFPTMYSVAGHVAHVADSVDWFVEGAFGKGWDMNFEELIAKAKSVTSLEEAVAWLDRSFENASAVIGAASDADFVTPIADKNIMEGAPKLAVVSGIVDHTAHHRGSLAVYARLLGKEPVMYYF